MFSFSGLVYDLRVYRNKIEIPSINFSSSAPKPAATAESAKAPKAPAAKSTTAAEAITTESAKSPAATEAIKAAALKALEPLARKITTRPVLSLAVQITRAASTAGPIETAPP
jgi:hypothetical protein